MNRRMEAVESICFLSRAESRASLMETLLESGPLDHRTLQQRLDYSRSTITRSLDSLSENGWVENSDGGYQLTPAGRAIISEFRELLETVETAEQLAPFLEWFPLSSFDLSLSDLRDGELTTALAGDPLAPARKQATLLQSTTVFRGLFPSMSIESVRLVHERRLDSGFETESVVSSDVAEMMHHEPFAPLLSELLSSGHHTIHVAEDVPMYLGIADGTTVQIGVEDDDGIPRALLETTNESVRTWAESMFSKYTASAVDTLTKL